ncbi:GTP-binding protein gtr1 [Cystobasidiomycetes sp. EMM_F5]
MDSAFSPPPPPRMPYMNGSLHSSRNSDDGNTLSNSIGPTSTSAPDSLVITTTTSAPPSAQPDRATFEHFDALPTAFSTATVLDAVYSDPHRRSMSAGTSTTPTVNTSFVTQSSVHDSPAPSPTESQAARWAREPPQRLPTLPANMPENAKEPSSVLASDVSRSRSRSASNSTALASVNDRDARPRTVSSANTTLKPIRETEPGSILCNKYLIDKCIGLGAFSRVLLARSIKGKERATVIIDSEDDTQNLLQQNLSDRSSIGNGKPPNLSSPKKSHSRTRSLGRSSGTSTPSKLQHSLAFSDDNEDDNVPAEPPDPPDTGESVAIKMISRSHVKKNDRMRISILREVEVLKHIRHPSLVRLIESFDSLFHTCLVLEYSSGGELFELIANHHEQMSEALVRRIFGEVADVLGWMHSIGLVHRDIKLENLILTSRPFQGLSDTFSAVYPQSDNMPDIPSPFVKLTDFGLSRFIDPASPYLETRCGSEEYAAPELIMGKRYDGRQTDAWALGVVLYSLIVGHLPFSEGQENLGAGISPSVKGSTKSRRSYLIRIAKGQYSWPIAKTAADGSTVIDDSTRLISEDLQTLAAALLCREPKHRLRVADVWNYAWMDGVGKPEKRSIAGGGLEGVSVTAFEGEDVAVVRAEVPEFGSI